VRQQRDNFSALKTITTFPTITYPALSTSLVGIDLKNITPARAPDILPSSVILPAATSEFLLFLLLPFLIVIFIFIPPQDSPLKTHPCHSPPLATLPTKSANPPPPNGTVFGNLAQTPTSALEWGGNVWRGEYWAGVIDGMGGWGGKLGG